MFIFGPLLLLEYTIKYFEFNSKAINYFQAPYLYKQCSFLYVSFPVVYGLSGDEVLYDTF